MSAFNRLMISSFVMLLILAACTDLDVIDPGTVDTSQWGSSQLYSSSLQISSTQISSSEDVKPSSSSEEVKPPLSSSSVVVNPPSSSSVVIPSSSSSAVVNPPSSSSVVVPPSSSSEVVNPPSSSSIVLISSSSLPVSSSSSSVTQSSSSEDCSAGKAGAISGPTFYHNGYVYQTLNIGGNFWFTENLRTPRDTLGVYCPAGAELDHFGCFFNWAAAFNVDQSFNNVESDNPSGFYSYVSGSSQAECPIGYVHYLGTTQGCVMDGAIIQGACPEGSHVANSHEWNDLYTFAGYDYKKFIGATCNGSFWFGEYAGSDSLGLGFEPGGTWFNNEFSHSAPEFYENSASANYWLPEGFITGNIGANRISIRNGFIYLRSENDKDLRTKGLNVRCVAD